MKKTCIFFIAMVSLTHCKTASNPVETIPAKEVTIQGEFLYWNNAAVLKTNTEIYGVIIDEKMHQLNDRCKPLKKDEYDMITVTIKAVIQENPTPESWNEIIRVKKILSVVRSTEKDASNIIINNNK